jgi:hypothetical protein
VHVSLGEPRIAARVIDAGCERAHRAVLVADEAMTCREIPLGRDAEIARA